MKFKVIHFILDHRVGGPHVYVQGIASALGARVNSTLVTSGRGVQTQIALFNLRRWCKALYVIEVPLNALLISFRFGIFRRADLFHVHGAANLAPLIAAYLCRMPVVWHFHETSSNLRSLAKIGSWFVRHTRNLVLTVALPSRHTYNQPNALLVPGAIDTEFWNPACVPARNECFGSSFDPSLPLRLVVVANINPLKGLDILLDALPHTGLFIHLDIIGAELNTHSKYYRLLKKRAEDISTIYPEITVRFLGSLSSHHIRTYLSECDIFVLPSRSEACPISLIEAMAMCCAVVASDVGSIRTMLPTAQHPFIFSPSLPRTLTTSLRKMAKLSSYDRIKLGQLNREKVMKEFCFERLANDLEFYYKSIAYKYKTHI